MKRRRILAAGIVVVTLAVLLVLRQETRQPALSGPDPLDTDGDRLPDAVEILLGTDPNIADTDGDDYDGICNRLVDTCDGDEILEHSTDPLCGDSEDTRKATPTPPPTPTPTPTPFFPSPGVTPPPEPTKTPVPGGLCKGIFGDGMPDWYEVVNLCLDPVVRDADENPDGDVTFTFPRPPFPTPLIPTPILNIDEYNALTDPCQIDSDGDDLNYNPITRSGCEGAVDTCDWDEFIRHGTDPFCSDSEDTRGAGSDGLCNLNGGDGMPDGYELASANTCLDPFVEDGAGDPDSDTLFNFEEFTYGTKPCTADSDNDGLVDGCEDANQNGAFEPELGEPPQVKLGETNALNSDTDGDTLSDGTEDTNQDCQRQPGETDPRLADTDGDGMPDNYEVTTPCVDPVVADGIVDFDADGLANVDEFTYGTEPCVTPDSDGDLLLDGCEDANQNGAFEPPVETNALNSDTDGDALSDGVEDANQNCVFEPELGETDPRLADTDGDGMRDDYEVATACVDPNDASDAALDADADGLANLQEFRYGTEPCVTPDSDGDLLLDGCEDANQNGAFEPELGEPPQVKLGETNALNSDSDGDTLPDGVEDANQNCFVNPGLGETDPRIADTDEDGLTDGDEVNLHFTDPLNTDTDGDGLSDGDEVNLYLTNPLSTDTDSDGMGDDYEVATSCVDPNDASDAALDADTDGLANLQEFRYGTEPCVTPDSDEDLLLDGCEDANQNGAFDPPVETNALDSDTDGDTLSDGGEDANQDCIFQPGLGETDPRQADTDGDGVPDGIEAAIPELDPLNPDSDGDGLPDGSEDQDGDGLVNALEALVGTDLTNPDTDGDGLSDGSEVITYGSDPLVVDTDGDGCTDGAEVAPTSAAAQGGGRDPVSHWDFMDQWTGSPFQRDRAIVAGDIGAIVARFGSFRVAPPTKAEALAEALTPPVDTASYHPSADRGGSLDGNPLHLAPPDGSIVAGDIGAVVAQFGHTCAAPP